ncbi:unnamed protein product, partial [Mesorhabditis spiculigera]
MTVPYHHQVATTKSQLIFKLLLRWKGSLWKSVGAEYIIWIILYFIIYAFYRYVLGESSQRDLEEFIRFCSSALDRIPLTFMLSFFVTTVVNRWTVMFQNLGMIDNIALFTSQYIKGNDDKGRLYRRNIARYCCLAQAILFRDISMKVRRRFPTMESLVPSGFMMEHELEKFNAIKNRYNKSWVPLNWAISLITMAKEEGRIDDDMLELATCVEIRHLRVNMATVWQHDWISIPVLYPQVVFAATYIYYILGLFARQFIIAKDQVNGEVDVHFPIVFSFSFILYVGWMKVAMALLNPFGEDDDDFDCNFLLDRNLTLSLGCQDEHHKIPEVKKDSFWDIDQAQPLYSLQSAMRKMNFFMGSATAQEEAEGGMDKKALDIEMVPHPTNERLMNRNEPELRRRRVVTGIMDGRQVL